MKAQAFLLRSGAVEVRAREAGTPEEYLASMEVDGGVTDDWPFLVRMAEAQMNEAYAIADDQAVRVQLHCGDRTFKLQKKRFDLDGQPHVCKHRRKE